jgi:hypothetical protein
MSYQYGAPLVNNNPYAQYEAAVVPPPPSYDVVQQEKFPQKPKSQDTIWAILFWLQFACKILNFYKVKKI